MSNKIKKLQEFRANAAPITYSDMAVRADGKLTVSDDRTIKGYAAVWGVVDSYGTIFHRGAFSKSIQERGPDSQSKYKITLLWQHDRRDPIGRIIVLREDDYGLYFEAEIDDFPQGDRALTQVRSGTINQFSFGFNYIWDKIEYNEDLDVFEVREVALFEISPVTIGSNMETFALRSPEGRNAIMEALNIETEEFIRSMPTDRQLEVRQLFARHISLRNIEPLDALEKRAKPEEDEGIDYDFLLNNLKL